MIHDLSSFTLAAIPVGGFMAQATDIVPSGLANITAGVFAMITAYFLWRHLEKKDNDQKQAQLAALEAKDAEIKRLTEDAKELKAVLFAEFQTKKENHHESR